VKPSFIPFLDLTLQHARAGTAIQPSWQPGELYSFELPDGTTASEAVVRRRGEDGRADEEVLRVSLANVGEDRGVRFRMPDRPGIYTISLGEAKAPRQLVAVNPAPEESRLVYDPEPEALTAWVHGGPTGGREIPQMEVVAVSEVLHQRIWWWLLLAGLVFLSLESIFLVGRKEPRDVVS
jgi:hypothetical protein